MRRLKIAVSGAAFFASLANAYAQEIVTAISVEDVVSAFSAQGMTEISDQAEYSELPIIEAMRDDFFTIQATLYDCAAGQCGGLHLIVPVRVRELETARRLESSVDASALGFNAWVQEEPPTVFIETYIVYDGGASDGLLNSTLHSLNFTIDQTKQFVIQDDPSVVEVWPQAATDE